jgi:hypothetical protein
MIIAGIWIDTPADVLCGSTALFPAADTTAAGANASGLTLKIASSTMILTN